MVKRHHDIISESESSSLGSITSKLASTKRTCHQKKKEKIVTFDEEISNIDCPHSRALLIPREKETAEERETREETEDDPDNDQWWTRKELETIRLSTKKLSHAIRKQNRYNSIIVKKKRKQQQEKLKQQQSLQKLQTKKQSVITPSTTSNGNNENKNSNCTNSNNYCPLAMGYKKTRLIVTSNLKQLVKLPLTTPVQDLGKWCARNDGRRGLEKISSELYYEWRSKDKSIIIEKVLQAQEKQKSSGEKYDPERLAEVSREASKLSRTFANYMGCADAITAGKSITPSSTASLKTAMTIPIDTTSTTNSATSSACISNNKIKNSNNEMFTNSFTGNVGSSSSSSPLVMGHNGRVSLMNTLLQNLNDSYYKNKNMIHKTNQLNNSSNNNYGNVTRNINNAFTVGGGPSSSFAMNNLANVLLQKQTATVSGGGNNVCTSPFLYSDVGKINMIHNINNNRIISPNQFVANPKDMAISQYLQPNQNDNKITNNHISNINQFNQLYKINNNNMFPNNNVVAANSSNNLHHLQMMTSSLRRI